MFLLMILTSTNGENIGAGSRVRVLNDYADAVCAEVAKSQYEVPAFRSLVNSSQKTMPQSYSRIYK